MAHVNLARALCVVVIASVLGGFWWVARVPEDATMPAFPLSPHRDIADDEKQHQLASLMKVGFRIRNPEKYLHSSDVIQLLEAALSIAKFQRSFKKMTYFVEPSAVVTGDLPPEIQGYTLQQLGSHLNQKMHDFTEEWLSAMNTVQKQVLHVPDQLEILLGMTGDEPLAPAIVEDILQVEEFSKAIEVLKSEKSGTLALVKVFDDNVKVKNPSFAKVQHLVKSLLDKKNSLTSLKRERQLVVQKHASARAEFSRLDEKYKNGQSAKRGQDAHLKYLEQELDSTNLKLDKARDDQRVFTYWMFGPFVPVWENDVKLAEKKVNDFNGAKEKLQRRIEALKDGSDRAAKELNEELETTKGSLDSAEILYKSSEEEVMAIEAKILHETHAISELQTRVEQQLNAEDKVSLQHWIAANDASNAFGETLRYSAGSLSTVTKEWTRQLTLVQHMSSFLAKARTKKDQVKLLGDFRSAMKGVPKFPLLAFIAEAVFPTSLALLPTRDVLADVLADSEDVPEESPAAPKQLEQ